MARARIAFTSEFSRHQEKRRDAFISRSKQARTDAIDRARQAAVQETESDTDMVRSLYTHCQLLSISITHLERATPHSWLSCKVAVVQHPALVLLPIFAAAPTPLWLQDTSDAPTHNAAGRAARKASRMCAYYANLLMTFEWLIEVPRTLGPAWRVMARPEGKRCLLIASRCHPKTASDD